VLTTLERVAALRRVSLFAATPDRVLAGVARVVDEVEVAAGDIVIVEGAIEDWLFVVVDGALQVQRQAGVFSLGPGAVVGEFAVLDPQPRSAGVVAVSNSLLFRLDKPAFDQALELRPEIARGVIVELVRRLRADAAG
jgi:CRP/FNR family transcriptional regulator, cyclic AMP receptor protein